MKLLRIMCLFDSVSLDNSDVEVVLKNMSNSLTQDRIVRDHRFVSV